MIAAIDSQRNTNSTMAQSGRLAARARSTSACALRPISPCATCCSPKAARSGARASRPSAWRSKSRSARRSRMASPEEFRRRMDVLARNVEAPIGTTLRVTVTGAVAFERWAGVDEEGRGVALDGLGVPDAERSSHRAQLAR